MVEFWPRPRRPPSRQKPSGRPREEARKKAEEAALQSGKCHALITCCPHYAEQERLRPTQREAWRCAPSRSRKEAISRPPPPWKKVEEALGCRQDYAIDSIPTLAELMPLHRREEDAWYVRGSAVRPCRRDVLQGG
ncbi:MAG: hypothetical protein ACLU9S_11470 [Oscillospiraceae bacterium]